MEFTKIIELNLDLPKAPPLYVNVANIIMFTPKPIGKGTALTLAGLPKAIDCKQTAEEILALIAKK